MTQYNRFKQKQKQRTEQWIALTIIPTDSDKISLSNQVHYMAIARSRSLSLYNHPMFM
jgi:hypothetical protein